MNDKPSRVTVYVDQTTAEKHKEAIERYVGFALKSLGIAEASAKPDEKEAAIRHYITWAFQSGYAHARVELSPPEE
jgi:hypothetical protein